MQATVRSYDPATGAGTVLLDDGSEVAFPGAATRGGGVRSLRSGQRVQVRLSPVDAGPQNTAEDSPQNSRQPASGRYVTALTISTLPEAGYLTDS